MKFLPRLFAVALLATLSASASATAGIGVDLRPLIGNPAGSATEVDPATGHLWLGGDLAGVPTLYEYDPSSQSVVSSFSMAPYSVFTLDPLTGNFFAFDSDNTPELAIVHPTGVVLSILPSAPRVLAACCDPSGNLFVLPYHTSPWLGNPMELQQIDRSTGSVVQSTTFPTLPNTSGLPGGYRFNDVDYDPASGGLVVYRDRAARLYSVDFATGAVTDYTETTAMSSVWDWSAELGIGPAGQTQYFRASYPFETHQLIAWPRHESNPTQFCAGDTATAICPCGNDEPHADTGTLRGCQNSGVLGSSLHGYGSAQLNAGSPSPWLRAHVPGQTFGVFFRGTSAIPPAPFGDGVRCVGGSLKRLQVVQSAPNGSLWYAETTVDLRVVDSIQPGDWRYYQYWFRDPAGPCGSGFNASSALRMRWL